MTEGEKYGATFFDVEAARQCVPEEAEELQSVEYEERIPETLDYNFAFVNASQALLTLKYDKLTHWRDLQVAYLLEDRATLFATSALVNGIDDTRLDFLRRFFHLPSEATSDDIQKACDARLSCMQAYHEITGLFRSVADLIDAREAVRSGEISPEDAENLADLIDLHASLEQRRHWRTHIEDE